MKDRPTLGELNRMTKKELISYGKSKAREANKRISMLKNKNLSGFSQAVGATQKGGKRKRTGSFKLNENMTRNEVLSEVMRIEGFLNAETSTVKGALAQKKSLTRLLGYEVNESEAKKIFQAFDELNDTYTALSYNTGSPQLLRTITKMVKQKSSMSIDDIVKKAHDVMVDESQKPERDIFEGAFSFGGFS